MNAATSLTSTPFDQQRLALDPSGLEALRWKAANRPEQAVREVAGQFEALFMNTLMEAMRTTSFDGEEDSNEMGTYKGMLDQQWVSLLSSSGGIGLADVLTRQIGKQAKLDDAALGEPQLVSRTRASSVLPQVAQRALDAYKAGRAEGAPVERVGEVVSAAAQQQPDAIEAAGQTGTASGAAGQFIERMLPHARKAAAALGVAPELLVAHAALESGWGRRPIRLADGSDSHNLFGIKAGSGWQGKVARVTTTEYLGQGAQKLVDGFRAYDSFAASFDDYANLLGNSTRYAGALGQGRNAAGFAQALQQGGYATDPRYARKLTELAQSLMGRA